MITRFAPSPTGPLHLGHAFSALTVWTEAARLDGTALLRIEDTDSTRCRPQFTQQIFDDLDWLGLTWPSPALHQSDHSEAYAQSLQSLTRLGLLYPCSCTRRQMLDAGGTIGTEGVIYPGTCRHRNMSTAQPSDALRLDIDKALRVLPAVISFTETSGAREAVHILPPRKCAQTLGDPVLRRKDTGDAAYLLACVHDDAAQGITHVIRGQDLWGQTPMQVILGHLLGLPIPKYHHHRLIADAQGERLAKVHNSKSIASYREAGVTPAELRAMVGL